MTDAGRGSGGRGVRSTPTGDEAQSTLDTAWPTSITRLRIVPRSVQAAISASAPRDDGPVPADARHRLIRGLEESIESRGYRATTVADIVAVAKASRRTFYRVFGTKDDVLLALLAEVNDELFADMSTATDSRLTWKEQVAASIDVYFSHVERRPAVHLCSIRELPYLGEVAAQLNRASADAFAGLIHDLTDNEEFRRAGLRPASRMQALMVQGALNELVAEILETTRNVRKCQELAVASVAALLSVDANSSPRPAVSKTRGGNAGPRRAARRSQ